MSEYIFGTTYKPHSNAEGRRRDRIAKNHGATYTGPVKLPGNRATGWFSCADKGHPFNGRVESAVLAEVNAGGAL